MSYATDSLQRRPILVTGAHRTGTTWVGQMLATSPNIGYIYEPFSPNHNHGICGATFRHWFTYITDENAPYYYPYLKRTIGFSYNLWEGVKAAKNFKDLYHLFADYPTYRKHRLTGSRPMFKDPIAFFSAEWLASTFDMDVVVLIRHPAAFIASLKRLKQSHPFSHFLEQPLLMRDHLGAFEAEIKENSENQYDVIDQGILLWRLIYYVLMKYREKRTDWTFVRHEDLALDPVGRYQNLFNALNLEFSSNSLRAVQQHSASSNPVDSHQREDVFKRNSPATTRIWKERLTQSEINRIREGVNDICAHFYSDEEW